MVKRLDKVQVLIKTFLRDAYLFEAIDAIRATMPEMKIIVMDDGERAPEKMSRYKMLHSQGHEARFLPFDSGFGAKSNAAIPYMDRPYTLIGSDDFNFRPQSVRAGIEKLVDVLDYGYVDIASGRYQNNPYEGNLIFLPNGEVRERRTEGLFGQQRTLNGTIYHPCDLTVNYSLIRSAVLGKLPGQVCWDDDVKIGGGEHGSFFIDAKRAGLKVAYVPGVNICAQMVKPIDPRYKKFRDRARGPERPCFEIRGIKKYVCFDGEVDWDVQ